MYNKILFISRHDPSKAGGGCYATRAYLETLIALFPGKVTLLADQGFQKEAISGYKDLAYIGYAKNRNRFQFARDLFTFRHSKFDRSLSSQLTSGTFDLAVLDNGVVAGSYVARLRKKGTEVVSIHHNNEVEYHRDNRTLDSLKGRFIAWIEKVQRRAYKLSDKNLFLTLADQQAFEARYGDRPHNYVIGCYEFLQEKTIIPSVDYSSFDSKAIRLISTGTLSAIQTKESIYWFVQQVYQNLAGTQLTVAGRNPEEKLVQFCQQHGVDMVPSPANMLDEIRKHDVYVCPVNLGGGLKLRIMDALKVGIICLIQEKSFRGYEALADQDFVFSFRDATDFPRQLEQCLLRIKRTPDLSKQIQKAYNEIFSFTAGSDRFKQLIYSSGQTVNMSSLTEETTH